MATIQKYSKYLYNCIKMILELKSTIVLQLYSYKFFYEQNKFLKLKRLKYEMFFEISSIFIWSHVGCLLEVQNIRIRNLIGCQKNRQKGIANEIAYSQGIRTFLISRRHPACDDIKIEQISKN